MGRDITAEDAGYQRLVLFCLVITSNCTFMSANEKSVSIILLLSRALQRIRTTPPRVIASPPTRSYYHLFVQIYRSISLLEPRRAAVALIIRVVPSPTAPVPPSLTNPPSLTDFFDLDWVNDPNARPEILFLRRDNPTADDVSPLRNTQEAHVAFPGGRMEPEDEGGLYTGERQSSHRASFSNFRTRVT